MKVVIAHTDFRIYWPARLIALCTFLKERNIQLEIVEIAGSGSQYGFAGDSDQRSGNWHCLFPGRKIEEIRPSLANKFLRRKLDEITPDIVIAGAIAFPSGAAATRWGDENKKRVIIFDDARLKDTPRSFIVNFIKRKIYFQVNAILCPSPAWNETYNFFGLNDENLFYGVNVVDNLFWQGEGFSEKFSGLPADYFLSIGRQVHKKNYMFLLKAYNAYAREISDPKHLVLTGDGPERSHLEYYVKAQGLKSVHFLPFLSQEQLKGLYKNASYFVLPSKFGETWGLVVNEAMAAGLPVIVSNQAGCASTLVKEGVNGYTFSPDNIIELSNLLLRMDKLPVQGRRALGQKSLEIISEWDLDRFCKGLYDAIQYVNGHELKTPDLLTRLIFKMWKGRYRLI